MSGHHGVKACDGEQRYHVVYQELDQHGEPRKLGSQFVGIRVTHLEQCNILVVFDLADVRVGGRWCGAHDGQAPDGDGHGDGEFSGPAAANRRVQLAHRVHDGEKPVRAQGGQREHRHAYRYISGGLRHLAYGRPEWPRIHLPTAE